MGETNTHFGALAGRRRTIDPVLGTLPTLPTDGDFYFDTRNNRMVVYLSSQWLYANFTTTTSTSTSTTTTSTSTTTTSTSTSTSTSSTTSTSTSTTTTL